MPDSVGMFIGAAIATTGLGIVIYELRHDLLDLGIVMVLIGLIGAGLTVIIR